MARILVIDDDQSLLQMMNMMLRRAGHESYLATNGHDGIEIARREMPDAAIVDVMMPELSGYEVCRILREDPKTMDIPLLILTALSQKEHRDQAQESGADDYVTKPVTRDDLVSHVEELIRTGARNMPAPLEPPPPVMSRDEPLAPMPPPDSAADRNPAQTKKPAVQPPPTVTPRQPVTPSGIPLVAVIGLSSGVGATSLAVNLGLALMQFGRSCLVDLHQQGGQVAVQLKMVPPRNTWVDLASEQGLDKRMIGSALMLDHAAGVAVLAGPLGPTRARLDGRSLSYLFSVLAEGFRRIVVDAQTSLDDMTLAALMHASHLVMVVGDDPADLVTVPETLRAVQSLKLPATHHVVLNHTRPSGVTHDAVMRAVNQPLSSDIPYEPAQAEALQKGMPLVMSRPDSLFSRALLQLARQL